MRSRSPTILPLLLCPVLLCVPTSGAAQQDPDTGAAEAAQRRRAAENAPLFAVEDPLAVTLRTDIKFLRDKRPEDEEVDGTLTFSASDGSPVTVPVKVRTRGNFRRSKANCNFPPLRLNFATRSVEGTAFEGQDKLKLVTPCHDSRKDYQQYVLQEYLVYQVFRLLTPASFRVRLLHVTYEDVNGAYDSRTKTAFVIEDDEAMAARNDAEVWAWERFSPQGPSDGAAAVRVLSAVDPREAVMTALFEFMIGNTDVSMPFMHNVVVLRTREGHYLPVPYDFDWSGVVNARYAKPDPQLPTRTVRERVYRGFCRPGVDPAAVGDRFRGIRDAIGVLYRNMEGLDARQRDKALEYYDDFFEVLDDPGKFDRQVVKACRRVG